MGRKKHVVLHHDVPLISLAHTIRHRSLPVRTLACLLINPSVAKAGVPPAQFNYLT
jgi:hypothetical protein